MTIRKCDEPRSSVESAGVVMDPSSIDSLALTRAKMRADEKYADFTDSSTSRSLESFRILNWRWLSSPVLADVR